MKKLRQLGHKVDLLRLCPNWFRMFWWRFFQTFVAERSFRVHEFLKSAICSHLVVWMYDLRHTGKRSSKMAQAKILCGTEPWSSYCTVRYYDKALERHVPPHQHECLDKQVPAFLQASPPSRKAWITTPDCLSGTARLQAGDTEHGWLINCKSLWPNSADHSGPMCLVAGITACLGEFLWCGVDLRWSKIQQNSIYKVRASIIFRRVSGANQSLVPDAFWIIICPHARLYV